MLVHPVIRQIVGRCHVSDSNLKVIRYAKSRLKPGAWQRLPREQRRTFMRMCIYQHQRNFIEYAYVMGGR